MDSFDKITEIWQKYERCEEQHLRTQLFSKTEQAHRFFEGDQWEGLESGKEKLPFFNFIQPACEYKIASIAQNNMTMHYLPMAETNAQITGICDTLNKHAQTIWEKKKMTQKMWDVIKEACIAGDGYIYFYDPDLNSQMIDNVNIYFGDEQEADIQKQPFIIIYERRYVSDIKEEAKRNGIPQDQIDGIVSDEDTTNQLGHGKIEVRGRGAEKCGSILYMEKKDGYVHFTRSTKTVIYQESTPVKEAMVDEDGTVLQEYGMTRYPIASFIWMRKKGSSRGCGEVQQLIPNQIAANKILARRDVVTKMAAFPKQVVSSTAVSNPEDIDKVGATIMVDGLVQRVQDAFAYVAPAGISSDAEKLQNELIQQSRELAGAGDAALGNINPENASGAAIIAVRDQQAIPLNEQKASFVQCVEDIALIWLDMWCAYNPEGLPVKIDEQTVMVDVQTMRDLELSVKVEVSPSNSFSKLAQQQTLDSLFAAGHLTFDEYVYALDDDSLVPKQKLKEILEQRMAAQNVQMQGIPTGAAGGQNAYPQAGNVPMPQV